MQAVCLISIVLVMILDLGEAAVLKKDPTYIVVAPTKIRPNQVVTIAATILKLEYGSFTITGIVRKLNGDTYEEICSTSHTFTREGTHDLKMKTREQMSPGNYTLRVSGYSDVNLEGQIFSNDTELFFERKQISVFIQTSKPFYRQGQTVRFRVIPIKTNLLPVSTTMDVRIKDPNGYVVREFYAQHTNAGGVVSLSYPLSSNLLAFGDWTIEVECLETKYNTSFRVEEFYPPLFYVNVSMPTYMLRNSFGLSGLIASNHTTGRGTKGSCIIELEIITPADENIRPIEKIIREIGYFDSRTDFLFTRQEMEQRAGGPNSLIGKELRVTGKVMDWFYNTTSVGYQSAIVYDEDVQLKFLGGEVWTFKPEMPFKIMIAAVKRDGSPLDPYNENRTINLRIEETIEIVGVRSRSDVTEISRDTSIAEYWITPSSKTTKISVLASYRNKRDTRRELVATRFWSPNNYYIQLSTPTTRPTVGQYMIFNVKTNTFVDTVYYHIVAAGNILMTDTLQMYSRNKLFSVALSRDMAPSARIIAYFVAIDGQVVTDSLNFHVNGTRLHEMNVRFNRGKDLSYGTVEITATADPLSYVAFSAIEYQLYELGARNGLSWEEVYKELYSFDSHANTSIQHYWQRNGQLSGSFYAPTPSFAHDANTTFYYSGLYIYTDANASAVWTECNRTQGKLPCMDGLSCYDYTKVCTYRADCPIDHLDEMGCPENNTYDVRLYNDDRLWRTKHIGSFYKDGGFMWKDQFTKPDGRIDIKVSVPTFPTTWVVSGFSMSQENGLAILPIPARFDGVRPLYISIQGPPEAMIGEHVSLRVSIFNFWDEALDVLLSIPSSPDYQFVAVRRDLASTQPSQPVNGAHQILVPVFPGGNRQINLPFVPRKFGHVTVPVSANSFVAGHTVNFHVFVKHYGVPEHYVTNFQVDLRTEVSRTLPDLFIPVDENYLTPEQRLQNYVPGSPTSKVYVIGDYTGISFFPYTDYDLNAENLLRQPYGTGAEAAFNFAANLYTLKMLRSLSRMSVDKVNRVIYTLNIALQELMFFMKEDGSFIEFRWSERSSTWLTATALQILSTSGKAVPDLYLDFQVPSDTVSKAALWLSSKQDNVTGVFREENYFYNRRFRSSETNGQGGNKQPANIALTALCVLALTEADSLNEEARDLVSIAKTKGADYLSSKVNEITDPFELAITSYALLKSGKQAPADVLMKALDDNKKIENDMLYWSTHRIPAIETGRGLDTNEQIQSKQFSNVTAYSVAATGYALLSYLQNKNDPNDIQMIQRFLQEQHMWVGGFASTQDTLAAMQALQTLAESDQNRPTYEMSFVFKSDQVPNWQKAVTINQDNWFDMQVIDLPSYWGSIQTTASGNGIALVQLETTLNHEHRFQLRKPNNDGRMIFDLGNFNNDIRTGGFNHSYIYYNLCPKYVGYGDRSGMSVLEVGIPSGYVVHNNTLKKYVQNQRDNTNSTLRNAEFYGGKAVFYFDYLDGSSDTNCANFSAFRWFPVANISENQFLRVFEYYEPGNFNYTFYEKIELRSLTICLVCGSYQCPYCPHYASGTLLTPSFITIALSLFVALLVNFECPVRRNSHKFFTYF